jgi:hypothetical protein
MELLSNHRAPAPAIADKPKRGVWRVEIRDEKTKQSLIVEHDEPVAAYVFIDPEVSARARRGAPRWQPGERQADGLLVGEIDGEAWVCFVELKTSLEHKDPTKSAPADRGLDQLEGSARHFHPLPGTRGREHHDSFADGSDELEVQPTKGHRVVGLLVALRRMPMPPPRRALQLEQSQVPLRTVRLSMTEPNRTRTTFRRLLDEARVLPAHAPKEPSGSQ